MQLPASPAPARVLGLACSAAGGVEDVRERLVEPLLAAGWSVVVTATPAAAAWLADLGEDRRIAAATGYPLRSTPRLPREPRPHPDPHCWVVAPATAGTVAKLALGIADNQAVTPVCEAIGARAVPVVVHPRVRAGHLGHPAWPGHLAALRSAGVRVVEGEPDGDVAWDAVLREVEAVALGEWTAGRPDHLSKNVRSDTF
ncbi:flavoprotein [Kineococcus gypseus]|uniref:flavoprotein n=1 Tax=Kineococcus gypseus TaxID=1637102 RepID=UPI003D7ED2BA